MTKSIQIKLLVAILAVLGVIAGLLARGGRRSVVLTPQDRELQRKLAQKTMPSAKRYIVP
jgi:hypothetical protein